MKVFFIISLFFAWAIPYTPQFFFVKTSQSVKTSPWSFQRFICVRHRCVRHHRRTRLHDYWKKRRRILRMMTCYSTKNG